MSEKKTGTLADGSPEWHLANLRAWIHNAKKNPLNEAQKEFAESIEIALRQVEREGYERGWAECRDEAAAIEHERETCGHTSGEYLCDECEVKRGSVP